MKLSWTLAGARCLSARVDSDLVDNTVCATWMVAVGAGVIKIDVVRAMTAGALYEQRVVRHFVSRTDLVGSTSVLTQYQTVLIFEPEPEELACLPPELEVLLEEELEV